MLSSFDKRYESLRRLREKHQFGITATRLADSAALSPEKEEQEKLQYTRHASPEEILGHLSTMPNFDLREEFDPGSTATDELKARCKELKYRARWLEALLNITNEELQMFSGALEARQTESESESESESDNHTKFHS